MCRASSGPDFTKCKYSLKICRLRSGPDLTKRKYSVKVSQIIPQMCRSGSGPDHYLTPLSYIYNNEYKFFLKY